VATAGAALSAQALTGAALAEAPTDASPHASRGPSDEASLALLRDHVRHTFSYNKLSLAGHLVGAGIILSTFWTVAPAMLRWGWGLAFFGLWLVRAALAWRYARGEPADVPGLLRRLRTWQVGVLAAGAMWGAAAWLFHGLGGALHQIALVIVVYTFCVACVPILAPQFRLYVLFVLLVFVPAVGSVAAQNTPLDWEVAGVMAVAMGMTMLLGRTYKDAFDASIRLKLRNEQLAAQLRAEKAVADEARAVAETASRGKTQFFAAASHDLRQPLHAMGLFAEALRQRVREPEVAQLVNSINESVGALEALFSQLLDITRIDSGGVDVKPAHVLLEDIFRKLKLHFEPAAFEKGLELRFRGGRQVVHADPLLVERVLRNLVANAIRYTEDGTVLVACRRRGDRVRLEVWDTGPGIRVEDQARIFEEFVQVEGSAPIESQERKGLGLGLAIVKRLAALLEAPLTLRSSSAAARSSPSSSRPARPARRRSGPWPRRRRPRDPRWRRRSRAAPSSSSRTSRRCATGSSCCCGSGARRRWRTTARWPSAAGSRRFRRTPRRPRCSSPTGGSPARSAPRPASTPSAPCAPASRACRRSSSVAR
jgi:signal transduction histidine kinase